MGLGDFLKSAVDAPLKGLEAFNEAIGLPTPDHRGGVKPGYAEPVLDATVNRPLKNLLGVYQYTKDNVFNQPLSTLELMGRETSVGEGGDWRKAFSASEWTKLWHAANHISPGTAITYGRKPGTSLADSNAAAQELINSPLEFASPDKAQLPPEWDKLPYEQQQQILGAAGAPQRNKAWATADHDSKWFHYASGASDFAISWYADPFVIGGKALGAVRAAKMVRPTRDFTAADIDRVMSSNLMTNTQRWLWANKDTPQLVNNLTMARKSAMGPQFGALLSTLKSEQEVNAFLRVTMGDARAMRFLEQTNRAFAGRIQSTTGRLSLLGQDLAAAKTPAERALVQQQIDIAEGMIAADKGMIGRHDDILSHAHELDALNLTRWSFARAVDRTEAQVVYRAGAARNFAPISLRAPGRAPQLLSIPTIGRAVRHSGGPLSPQRAPGGLYPTAEAIVGRRITPGPGVGRRALAAAGAPSWMLGGVRTSRIYTDFWGMPVTIARAFGNFRPAGHMQVQGISQEAVNELRGYLARIPNISEQARAGMVNDYLRSGSAMDRKNLLLGFEKLATAKIAQKHGFTPKDGLAVFRQHRVKQDAEIERMVQFSTARTADAAGRTSYADYFHTQGGAIKVAPNLMTRLVNDHVFMDLDRLDTLLTRHGSALKALRVHGGSVVDVMEKLGDAFNSMWKFGTLFRLGYIPRVLGDDLAGQVARLGGVAMAIRAGVGVKNLATNTALWWEKPFLEQRATVREAGIKYASADLAQTQQQAKLMGNFLRTEATQRQIQLDRTYRQLTAAQAKRAALGPNARATTIAAHDQFVARRQGAFRAAQLRVAAPPSPGKTAHLAKLRDRETFIQQYLSLAGKEAKEARDKIAAGRTLQGKQPLMVNGLALPGALAGIRGEFYQKLISPDQSLENIFGANQGYFHGLIRRSFDHGAIQARAVANPELHMQGWLHIINHQFAQDELGQQALAGASVEDMTRWLTTDPRGSAYFKQLGIRNDSPEYLAQSVKADIDELVDDPDIRAKALTPEGVSADDLEKAYPKLEYRPDVHVGQTYAGARETLATSQKIFRLWFDTMAGIPAARWSRHPLFNQLYEGHAKAIVAKEAAMGTRHTTADADRIAETARRLALKDTRNLVFDVTHRSDAVAALRLASPFFAAVSEGWQRWGRIIADRPETVGYAAKFFNTPLSLGMVQDGNGNAVDRYGYAYDPESKKRYLVPKTDRHIVTRLPKWMLSWGAGVLFNADASGKINLSQDSMNLVFSGDPVFNPGTGPIVQIPVQEFVADKPDLAALARAAGVLPFGVDTSTTSTSGRFANAVLPRSFRQFMTAFDTSDSRYQGVKLHIMQQAAFEHDHLGKPMPSPQAIADRVRSYWLFSAASAFLGPIAGRREDPYQFYRDQYYKLRASNAFTADDEFIKRYGESYFVFAQAQSKNAAHLEANRGAVALSKKHAGLIADMPELGALVVGPNGTGSPFDPDSYAYQLNTPLTPGSNVMQRGRLSADEAMAENQRRLGWARYTAQMHRIEAKLHRAGFQSFNDPGAEDFKAEKKAWTNVYSQRLYPDGRVNPNYNQAWADDYNSYDQQKYDKMVPHLLELANSDLAKDPQRTDLYTLGKYLGGRQQVMSMLNERRATGGSAVLTARDNFDLLAQWEAFVQGLVESDTRFGDLHHRYLARDLGTDAVPQEGGR